MLNPTLQVLGQFLFITSLIRLRQKIDASASLTFSVASGSGHRETKLCEGLDLGQQSCALPGTCVSPSLAPSFLVPARDVSRRMN